MPNATLSDLAIEQVLLKKAEHSRHGGRDCIPYLLYYRRSYFTPNNGKPRELGAGFVLSFVEKTEACDPSYLRLTLRGDNDILLAPRDFFHDNVYLIDWNGKEFILKSSAKV
jgi:hypothetical protein